MKRIKDRGGEVPAEVNADLDALDAALRGEELPDELASLATLATDVRDERPEADPDFDAALDAWAAAGFPRGGRPGLEKASGGAGPLPARWSPFGPRGWLPVAAAAAALIVVVGVSITQIGGGEEGGVQTLEAPSPAAEDAPAGGAESVGGAAPLSPESSADGATALDVQNAKRASEGDLGLLSQGKRKVERDASLTLTAPASEVPDVADRAIEVVENADGIVRSSRVSGEGDAARATLRLKVPAANLDQVLSELTDLANVSSRTEETSDVTGAVVNTRDRLIALRAERESLATRLRAATGDDEASDLRTALTRINRRIARERADLSRLRSEVRFATVDLEITSSGAAEGGEDDGWSFGDALDDAGKVLEVAAGVALISAAVLLPLALIAAIAYVAATAARAKARERVLDED
jgi:hypothetical protein